MVEVPRPNNARADSRVGGGGGKLASDGDGDGGEPEPLFFRMPRADRDGVAGVAAKVERTGVDVCGCKCVNEAERRLNRWMDAVFGVPCVTGMATLDPETGKPDACWIRWISRSAAPRASSSASFKACSAFSLSAAAASSRTARRLLKRRCKQKSDN